MLAHPAMLQHAKGGPAGRRQPCPPHPVHDDRVQGGLAVLVRRPAVADRQVALVLLASRAALRAWRELPKAAVSQTDCQKPTRSSPLPSPLSTSPRAYAVLAGHNGCKPPPQLSMMCSINTGCACRWFSLLSHLFDGVNGRADAVLGCDCVPGRLCAAANCVCQMLDQTIRAREACG